MRIAPAIAAVTAVTLLTGSALAGTDDDVFGLGSHLLGGGESISEAVEVVDTGFDVIGFTVEWDYSEPTPDSSWASDVQVVVTSPSGESFTVGGFTNMFLADDLWSFTGNQSDGPGHYGDLDTFLPWESDPQSAGTWNVSFANDWEVDFNPNQYDNIQITFHRAVPAPGALALLGLAGVIATRRRRA